ncbi:MAG: toll/interleukin-1 receptor domain-containing protein [Caldimonas sp.]
MSDIFVSYSSKDRDRAALVARALEASGCSVWWERTIPPGRQYDDVIEEALAEARCVVVLWSKASAASTWVKNEASEAVDKKALIPALIEDGVKIPFEFRRVQAADLSRWQGDATATEFVQFCDAIAAEVAAATQGPALPEPSVRAASPAPVPAPSPASAAPFAPPPPVPPVVAATSNKKLYIIGGVVVFLLLGIASMVNEQRQQQQVPQQQPAAPMPGLAPSTMPVATGGVHQHLVWRDYVLAYSGNVSWDGRSNTASIVVNVNDGNAQQPLGGRQLQARVNPNGPNQIVMSTSVAVPGGSRTPGPHSHNLDLVFQSQGDGDWTFVHNCMSPNDCY